MRSCYQRSIYTGCFCIHVLPAPRQMTRSPPSLPNCCTTLRTPSSSMTPVLLGLLATSWPVLCYIDGLNRRPMRCMTTSMFKNKANADRKNGNRQKSWDSVWYYCPSGTRRPSGPVDPRTCGIHACTYARLRLPACLARRRAILRRAFGSRICAYAAFAR